MKHKLFALCAAAWLTGCEYFEIGARWFSDHGTVYLCSTPGYADIELCSDLDADELAARIWPTTECHRSTRTIGTFVFGCVMTCGTELEHGCNALGGCYCGARGQ